MTAIVGTLNRRGIAFAADSAATLTISGKQKITNHTNKIFALSKKYPVGVAVYNNLDFHGVPWENLFKMYRDNHLKDNSFGALSEYADDFWQYVSNTILPKLSQDQKVHVAIMTNGLYNETKSIAENALSSEGLSSDTTHLFPKMIEILKRFTTDYSKGEIGEGFEGYSKEMFISFADPIVSSILTPSISDINYPTDFINVFEEALYWICMSKSNVYLNYTGIVFWGYGEEDLFPSYYHYQVGLAFDNRIKHVELEHYNVSNSNNACVVPFAQPDVANTVVRGIDQKLKDTITDGVYHHFDSFRNDIKEVLRKASAPDILLNAIANINIGDMVSPFVDDLNNYIRENYTGKLLDTVALLNKEDLADMAESLVRMTSLKRHVTTDDETVGGPVDVAVITKGDGFIWIKRKHYFTPELNHHYFEK